jgi:hypothetical protein
MPKPYQSPRSIEELQAEVARLLAECEDDRAKFCGFVAVAVLCYGLALLGILLVAVFS